MILKTRQKLLIFLISLEIITLLSMQITRITRVREGNIPEGATSRDDHLEFLKLEKQNCSWLAIRLNLFLY